MIGRLTVPSLALAVAFQSCGPAFAEGVARSARFSSGAVVVDSRVMECKLVRRAARTWVGFGPGLSLRDLEFSARASVAIVRTLDALVCDLARRGIVHEQLLDDRVNLAHVASRGGHFEVDKVRLSDGDVLNATASLREVAPSRAGAAERTWEASLFADVDGWQLAGLERRAPTQ